MQDKEVEKKGFDAFTSEESWDVFTEKTLDKIIKLFLRYVKPKKDDKIIDSGCGTGELTKKIKRLSFKNVSGFDISRNCILWAKKQSIGVNFQVKDIEKTALKNESVDVLLYVGVLHHFKDQTKVLREAHRILKKGCKLFFFDPNASNPVMWLFRNKNSPLRSNKLKTSNEEFFNKDQIKRIFEKEKFKIMKLDCISEISYTKKHFKKILPFPFFYLVYI